LAPHENGRESDVRAVVFANGDPPSRQLVSELADGADLVVAADGGADAALAAGVTPALVIGDLDSLSKAARASIRRDVIIRDPDPNRTDLQKAIEACIARGATEIAVLGTGGGRADHALANLSVLLLYRDRTAIRFVDEQFSISVSPGRTSCVGPPGTVVSLVAMGECRGVTTLGLRWDLEDATLPFSPLGVHNEIRKSPASIAVQSGDLLVFQGRWV